MPSISEILMGLFVIILFFVIWDFAFEFMNVQLFGSEVLPDFSLMRLLGDLMYIIACLWTWKDILLQRMVYGDFVTPIELLLRIIIVFALTMLDSSIEMIFDLIAFPFQLVVDGIEAFTNDPIEVVLFDDNSLYVSFNFITFTFRGGIDGNIMGTGVQIFFQFSILGTEALTNGYMEFCELGFLGLQVAGAPIVLGMPMYPPFVFELDKYVSQVLGALLTEFSTPQALYEYLLDLMK